MSKRTRIGALNEMIGLRTEFVVDATTFDAAMQMLELPGIHNRVDFVVDADFAVSCYEADGLGGRGFDLVARAMIKHKENIRRNSRLN